MRLHFLALVLAGFIFSCNNANNDKQADGADSTRNTGTTSPRTITDAIEDLKTVLESKNRSNIADLFEFPMADTVMAVYLDDSVFKMNYQAAGDRLTKSMFLKYYDTIARYSNLSDIIAGLKDLPVDSLRYTNKIETEIKSKREPCVAFCSIEVNGNEVTLKYSTLANDEYVKPKGSSEDDESYVAGCEYASMWFFVFDGNKLKFVRQAAAG
jgi:hypothetical protein